jgi:hypothetical protein
MGSSLSGGSSLSCGCYNQEKRKKRTGKNHPNWKGGRRINKYGYVVLSVNGRKVLEHVLVMESYLHRKLYKGEQVHHKNGIKTRQSPKNLELWTRNQPTGKRVEDLAEFAIEVLKR